MTGKPADKIHEVHAAAARAPARHPGIQALLRWFEFGHLPSGKSRTISEYCFKSAMLMAGYLDDGPELTAGLRKLLEAKDCFVRQAIVDEEKHE